VGRVGAIFGGKEIGGNCVEGKEGTLACAIDDSNKVGTVGCF
jgi:hypothetical protein